MKKGNRSLLKKNILGILFIAIAIVFTIYSENVTNECIFGVMFFGIAGIYTLLMPVEPFKQIFNLLKSIFK